MIGTIQKVEPPRWTTPDGQRPDALNASEITATIFRPVLVEVEAYLKGDPQPDPLPIFAWGGQIGRDSFVQEPGYFFEYREGERVLLFLQPNQLPVDGAHVGLPFWHPVERYTITAEGQAENYYRTLPLDQLINEIRTAQEEAIE